MASASAALARAMASAVAGTALALAAVWMRLMAIGSLSFIFWRLGLSHGIWAVRPDDEGAVTDP
jgi:hypothetical protein